MSARIPSQEDLDVVMSLPQYLRDVLPIAEMAARTAKEMAERGPGEATEQGAAVCALRERLREFRRVVREVAELAAMVRLDASKEER